MPYIEEKERKQFQKAIDVLGSFIDSKGQLNYVICELVGRLILEFGISYTKMSEWINVVHDAEAELRRRLLDAYENDKIVENGDVESFKIILKMMGK